MSNPAPNGPIPNGPTPNRGPLPAAPRPPGSRSAGWARTRRVLRVVFAPIAVALAILYFLVDAIVLSLVYPITRRLVRWPPIERFMGWVATLGPYSTLAFLLVPIIVLEPLKPAAFYLMAKHRVGSGTALLVLTEIVKIVTVERLFRLSRAKLMTIPAFARVYTYTAGWLAYLQALPPWQFVLRRVNQIKALSRRLVAVLRGLI